MECGGLAAALRLNPRRQNAQRAPQQPPLPAINLDSHRKIISSLLKYPLIPTHHNSRMPIRPRTPINALQRIPVPPTAHLRNMRHNPRKPAKQFRGISPGNPSQLAVRNLIANLVVPPMTTIRTVVPWMRPVSTDQRLHRVKSRVPEEPHK